MKDLRATKIWIMNMIVFQCGATLTCSAAEGERQREREKERKLLVPDPRMPNAFYTLTKNTGKDYL